MIYPLLASNDDQLLEDLLAHLRSKHGTAVRVLEQGEGRLTLQIGNAERAVLGVGIKDALRPSFTVDYPALKVKRDGERRVQDVHFEGVLLEAIEWIVRELAQHGVVPPASGD